MLLGFFQRMLPVLVLEYSINSLLYYIYSITLSYFLETQPFISNTNTEAPRIQYMYTSVKVLQCIFFLQNSITSSEKCVDPDQLASTQDMGLGFVFRLV